MCFFHSHLPSCALIFFYAHSCCALNFFSRSLQSNMLSLNITKPVTGQHYFYRPSAISTAPPAGQGLESLARQRLKSHHTKNPNNVHMLDVLIYARIVHACVTARTPWAHSRCCTAAASGYVVRQSCTTHTTEDEDTKSSGLCTALPYKDISRSV